MNKMSTHTNTVFLSCFTSFSPSLPSSNFLPFPGDEWTAWLTFPFTHAKETHTQTCFSCHALPLSFPLYLPLILFPSQVTIGLHGSLTLSLTPRKHPHNTCKHKHGLLFVLSLSFLPLIILFPSQVTNRLVGSPSLSLTPAREHTHTQTPPPHL